MAPSEAVLLLREGIAAARSGDKTRTRTLLRQVTDLDPQNEMAWLWRANSADQPEEVVDCLRKALEVNPNNENAKAALPDALVRAAAALTNDRPKAKRLLVEATTLAPRHEVAWLWRAGLADSPEESTKYLQTVLAINPNNEKAKHGLQKLMQQRQSQWQCPVCDHPDSAPQPMCSKCGCVLTLEAPEAFDTPRAVNRSVLEATAKRLYAAIKEENRFEWIYTIGMVYLNLGFIEEGIRTLQAACRAKAADPALRTRLTRFIQHRESFQRKATRQDTLEIRKPLVFVVDDSPTIRKLVSVTLNAAGYRVMEADGGYAAADLLREHGIPGVFILDVNMPGIDGFTLCKTLRANPETAKTPVVFLTGKEGLLNKLRGQWAGASEYLTKPFEPQRLLATIGKLLPLTAIQ
jgi:twitching motility two-component system response regulator PilG